MYFETETRAYIEADEAPKVKVVKYDIKDSEPAFPITIASKKDVVIRPEDRPKIFQHFSAENAEYSAEGNRFYFSNRQIGYMRTHLDADIKIAVYGLERNKETAPDFIKDAFVPDTSKGVSFHFHLP